MGKATDKENKLVLNVLVYTIFRSAKSQSDSNGIYFLSNLSPGICTLFFAKTGYKVISTQIELKAGETLVINESIEPEEFLCGKSIITCAENVYNTVRIGNQCWLKENLNIGTMINGKQNQADNGIVEKYCYENDEHNCELMADYINGMKLCSIITEHHQRVSVLKAGIFLQMWSFNYLQIL